MKSADVNEVGLRLVKMRLEATQAVQELGMALHHLEEVQELLENNGPEAAENAAGARDAFGAAAMGLQDLADECESLAEGILKGWKERV